MPKQQIVFIDLTQVPDSPPPRRALPARYTNLVILPPPVPPMPCFPLEEDRKRRKATEDSPPAQDRKRQTATTAEELLCDEDFVECVMP